jgi:D-allose transport system substrate-binding protein
MKKCWFISATAAMLLMSCTLAVAAERSIGVLLKDVRDPFWKFAAEGATAAGKELGVKVTSLATQSNADVGPQLEICNTMIQQKLDAFIVAAVNPTGLFSCLTQLTKAGVPVLDMDANVVRDQADKAGVKVVNSVGADNHQVGAMAADYIAKRMPNGKVLLIEGLPGALPSIGRRDGFKEEMAKAHPDIQIVASLNADWDANKAANITTDILTRYPDLGAIYCVSDQMALGAAEAARAAGKSDLITVGTDGMPDIIKAIKEGHMTATVAQLPYLMGYQSVTIANEILDGKHLEPWKQSVPVFVVDKDILAANTEPLLKWLKQQ